jgi:hypothetical protein
MIDCRHHVQDVNLGVKLAAQLQGVTNHVRRLLAQIFCDQNPLDLYTHRFLPWCTTTRNDNTTFLQQYQEPFSLQAAADEAIPDIFFLRRSAVPGVVYLLAGLGATGVMVADLLSLRDMVDQIQSMTVLFGIELADVIEAFGQFIEIEIVLLPGTYLTLLGLGCLLLGGIARSAASLADRRQRE